MGCDQRKIVLGKLGVELFLHHNSSTTGHSLLLTLAAWWVQCKAKARSPQQTTLVLIPCCISRGCFPHPGHTVPSHPSPFTHPAVRVTGCRAHHPSHSLCPRLWVFVVVAVHYYMRSNCQGDCLARILSPGPCPRFGWSSSFLFFPSLSLFSLWALTLRHLHFCHDSHTPATTIHMWGNYQAQTINSLSRTGSAYGHSFIVA